MTGCHSVPSEGRKGPLEKVLNILSCPLRGALSSATRGQIPIATLDPKGGAKRRRGWIVFRFCLPLRPLSRVASDYSSGSVVCFWILRPLRPLREIKIIAFFHAKNAKSAKFLFTFLFNAGAEGVANFVTTRVRREFIHPLPPCGVLHPVSGGESVTTEYHRAS